MTTRLWLADRDLSDLPTSLEAPDGPPEASEALEAWLSGRASGSGGDREALQVTLDALAEGPGRDSQLLVRLPPGGSAQLAAELLGIARGAVEARSVTLDWTVGDAPQLIGVDLDWVPPFRPERRARFPGGPGVAGSARA